MIGGLRLSSLAEVLEIRKELYEKSVALIAKKGHDYNRTQQDAGDTLFNLKVCALLGIVDKPERGVLVRLSDKFMRLISLFDAEAANKNESFEDTVVDVHNYIDYLALMRRERIKDAEKEKVHECSSCPCYLCNAGGVFNSVSCCQADGGA